MEKLEMEILNFYPADYKRVTFWITELNIIP